MDSPDIHETSITIRQALIIRLGWPPGSPRRERDMAGRTVSLDPLTKLSGSVLA
jgi:hypothetical protein